MQTQKYIPNILNDIRASLRSAYLADEDKIVEELVEGLKLKDSERTEISAKAVELVEDVRNSPHQGLMENFLNEYGLSTQEGVALMCLAEALLRVPDAETIDAIIEDKIAPSDWGKHLGQSSSSLVNASTWGLMLTGKVLAEDEAGLVGALKSVVKRLGEPVIRVAVGQAMKELGRQFVLGSNIEKALKRAKSKEKHGYTYSYDMLGEAARTKADAIVYHKAYSDAIAALAEYCTSDNVRENPGISVKLSALHPRYEFIQRDLVMSELVETTRDLAYKAKAANMGFNIDAEEADRLDLSLDVIEAVLSDPKLEGWDGFGVVVQAYGQRASYVIDWLYSLACNLNRRIMVRLVKGAYWDTEIKRAQVLGLTGFPVFTRKVNTDISYMLCAQKLFQYADRIYPQFATHNAHTIASILHMAKGQDNFEFQRLHGMGQTLHDIIIKKYQSRCRIYAPVGAHEDLLAYLVRRLLENGANSSFVNQIVDKNVPPQEIVKDPVTTLEGYDTISNPHITKAMDLYGEKRINSKGWDITDPIIFEELDKERLPYLDRQWNIENNFTGPKRTVINPANPSDIVGTINDALPADVTRAFRAAKLLQPTWEALTPSERTQCLKRAADLYEKHTSELIALACREAGKNLFDAIGEIREAVDFLRYYAVQGGDLSGNARGIFVCISPWNFPLAIFTGQVAAALMAGNAVLAKPAEQTPLIAARAVELLHLAGIPEEILQLLPGEGESVGAALTSSKDVSGVCFTGSTETAQIINKSLALSASSAAFIAETGGLNAMIVDSTALPEQTVMDVVASAFQSAGQRCSALRVLYIQQDIKDRILKMLFGAMDALKIGDPWHPSSDIGPVIDDEAYNSISSYCTKMEQDGRLLKKIDTPGKGRFISPSVFKIDGIYELEQEIFGPVLHVATYESHEIDKVIQDINSTGYGLTFGLHTRIDDRVQQVVDAISAGNLYINRNQIGAIVGSQPFGGEGLSGTGPKAGGPLYMRRFTKNDEVNDNEMSTNEGLLSFDDLQELIWSIDTCGWRNKPDRIRYLKTIISNSFAKKAPSLIEDIFKVVENMPLGGLDLPGPTGESNRLSIHPKGIFICLGPSSEALIAQALQALSLGCGVVMPDCSVSEVLLKADLPIAVFKGNLEAKLFKTIQGISGVCFASKCNDRTKEFRSILAQRKGPILPLVTDMIAPELFIHERTICIDTTAAGGNAALLAEIV